MTCKECGSPLGIGGARGRLPRFCSNACRQRAYRRRRATPIPAVMRDTARWARAAGKRPIQIDGTAASSTNPATWSTYSKVLKSKAGDGFGFMLGDGIGCYDLDNAIDNGVVKSWARDVIDAIAEPVVYVEKSVSGRGLHVFVELAEQMGSRRSVGDGSVEKYSYGRFIRCGEPSSLEEVMSDARSTAEEE